MTGVASAAADRVLRPPIALVGLKAYFTHARTVEWFSGLVRLVEQGRADGLTTVVVPSATALASLAAPAGAVGVVLGAQDCSPHPHGAWTGELPATLLAEVGARVVEVGHVERRRLGDTDEVVAAKTRAAVAAGMVPMLCVGEAGAAAPDEAAAQVQRQLATWLAGVPRDAEVLVAYEPDHAIGAAAPASPAHVVAVVRRVRAWLERYPAASLVYGGAAGPGTYRALVGAVDGLGLGRRVHDLHALAEVFDDMREAHGLAGRRNE